jgi:hypothetical protein
MTDFQSGKQELDDFDMEHVEPSELEEYQDNNSASTPRHRRGDPWRGPVPRPLRLLHSHDLSVGDVFDSLESAEISMRELQAKQSRVAHCSIRGGINGEKRGRKEKGRLAFVCSLGCTFYCKFIQWQCGRDTNVRWRCVERDPHSCEESEKKPRATLLPYTIEQITEALLRYYPESVEKLRGNCIKAQHRTSKLAELISNFVARDIEYNTSKKVWKALVARESRESQQFEGKAEGEWDMRTSISDDKEDSGSEANTNFDTAKLQSIEKTHMSASHGSGSKDWFENNGDIGFSWDVNEIQQARTSIGAPSSEATSNLGASPLKTTESMYSIDEKDSTFTMDES